MSINYSCTKESIVSIQSTSTWEDGNDEHDGSPVEAREAPVAPPVDQIKHRIYPRRRMYELTGNKDAAVKMHQPITQKCSASR